VERVRRLRLPALAGLSSLLFAAASPAAEPARPGDPSARVLAEVVLPDLRATLVHAEATLASVAPGTLPPGTLQAMLGAQLKDPGLAALGAGPVVALVLAPESASSAPGVVLYLPVKNAQASSRPPTRPPWPAAAPSRPATGPSAPPAGPGRRPTSASASSHPR